MLSYRQQPLVARGASHGRVAHERAVGELHERRRPRPLQTPPGDELTPPPYPGTWGGYDSDLLDANRPNRDSDSGGR
jgi:hypothetical protein